MKEAKEKPIKYSSTVGMKKESFPDLLKKVFPPTMVPTEKTGWIFGTIFVIVVIIGLLQFPLNSLLAGKTDVAIEVGLPWTFLKFDLENPETLPVKFGGLILDLIIYLIISYTIDVAINVVYISFTHTKGKKTKRPSIYKIPEKTIAEKAAQKTQEVIGGEIKNPKNP